MKNKIIVKGCKFATNNDGEGVFELIDGCYSQLEGTCQTPTFKSEAQFRRYIYKNIMPPVEKSDFFDNYPMPETRRSASYIIAQAVKAEAVRAERAAYDAAADAACIAAAKEQAAQTGR